MSVNFQILFFCYFFPVFHVESFIQMSMFKNGMLKKKKEWCAQTLFAEQRALLQGARAERGFWWLTIMSPAAFDCDQFIISTVPSLAIHSVWEKATNNLDLFST